ncbi:alcohol dehydrogenase [Melanomma pulvis-pyrius CBS 109.77]|uniref:Alcohol dehydrogenase n=1 Tax=Melanomma pulvis-pyrius CBS 109.77 TaxID=1314802 RepID=A0A6A6XYF1_9PLEO|nr:alcohol dehydrogenase [Melanomma pulvis-pyrius CBS 109.77]
MRALIRTGSSNTPTYTATHPPPTSTSDPTNYIIRTHATSLTRGELAWPEPLIPSIPVPGYDLAGTVLSIPSAPHPTGGAYTFAPGDEVYALTSFSGLGNAREVSVAAEREISLKPRNVGWEEAATVPLSALSAWQALFVHGKLEPVFPAKGESRNEGKRVLVTAASGGVGIWGVQLAHQAGTTVVGTCGTSNVEFVKGLGADTVLDYSKTKLLEWVGEDREKRGFDVVLDCIGGQTLEDSWKCVREGGRLISVAEPPDSKTPAEGIKDGVQSTYFIVEADGAQLGEVTKLIEQGKCSGVLDSVYDLAEWKEAFERLEGGHAKGKVVLKLI